MKTLLTILIAITLCGCVAKHKRILNDGEKTLVSDAVHALVMATDEGLLDICQHDNVRYERIRIVGAHLVTRLCFTREEEAMMRKTREECWTFRSAWTALVEAAARWADVSYLA